MNTSNTTTEALQNRLGDQLRRLRLARDLDQLTLADKAGVSEKALRNLEAGRGSSLSTLLQVLRALDRLDWLDTLSPVASVSPMALLRRAPAPQGRRSEIAAGARHGHPRHRSPPLGPARWRRRARPAGRLPRLRIRPGLAPPRHRTRATDHANRCGGTGVPVPRPRPPQLPRPARPTRRRPPRRLRQRPDRC